MCTQPVQMVACCWQCLTLNLAAVWPPLAARLQHEDCQQELPVPRVRRMRSGCLTLGVRRGTQELIPLRRDPVMQDFHLACSLAVSLPLNL